VGHAHPQLLLPAALYTRNHHLTIAHGNDYLAAQRRWHRSLFNWLLGHSHPLVTHTRANAQRLNELGFAGARVIYPGTDPIRFTPAVAVPPFPPVLLTVGRLVSRKGIDTVLEALPLLLLRVPDLQYMIVGDGPDRPRLQSLVQALKLQNVVSFRGEVTDAQLLATYHQAHIFVMPVREEQQAASVEGFGIVYLEASACGLPVIAGRSGGAIEAVRDGQTGYLVEPRDPEALAKKVLTLLQNAELRQQMGQNGRRWVETEMNWDRAAQQFLQILV
jgi:phosphatidylinositol alpha-1,6-mannosyltransferase